MASKLTDANHVSIFLEEHWRDVHRVSCDALKDPGKMRQLHQDRSRNFGKGSREGSDKRNAASPKQLGQS